MAKLTTELLLQPEKLSESERVQYQLAEELAMEWCDVQEVSERLSPPTEPIEAEKSLLLKQMN